MKARKCRGQRRALWVAALRSDLLDEFDILRNLGVKFNASLLLRLVHTLISNAQSGPYFATMLDPQTSYLLKTTVTPSWIQTFMQPHGVVSRSQCGKLWVSPEQQEKIERGTI